ncbi:unnamed protein product [Ilex paraguariensis]|uniref:Uncharacterized protein n=1 Tax=Ilex paraguariensis TaxID=185542 RepID=A0ABC8RFZ9_9AQUA
MEIGVLTTENEELKKVIKCMERNKTTKNQREECTDNVVMETQILDFVIKLMEKDIQIFELENLVKVMKKENDDVKAKMAQLEAKNRELINQINELSVHAITQRFHNLSNQVHTPSITPESDDQIQQVQNTSSKVGQYSIVRRIKLKERKRNRDADYEYSKRKRGKKDDVTSHELEKSKGIVKLSNQNECEIINIDDSNGKTTTLQETNKREIAKWWKGCKALAPQEYNKLKQIHGSTGDL